MIDDPEEEAWQELEAKLKRANELAEYRLKLLVQIPENKPWVSLTDRDITGAAHNEAKHPIFILETTDSGLCMRFSETGEWHASDKKGDFMKVNSFLMSFAKAIEAKLKDKNT